MGVKDFESMFDTIDLSRKGTVSSVQMHGFCEALYYSPVCMQHVEGAMKLVCQNPAAVTRRDFLDVLTDVERRRAVDEQAYWDFQALDYTGKNRITLHNALLLFKDIHGDSFSMATWNRFLSSREIRDADVFFDEIRFWLCSPPVGSTCSEKDLKDEENKMLARQADHGLQGYNNLLESLGDDSTTEMADHIEEQTAQARRKLNKWNTQGVEAMLFDDGSEVDDTEVKVKPKGHVTVSDINQLLEVKYSKLKEKLMHEMARQSAAVEDEIPELIEQIRRNLKHLVREGLNASDIDDIPGATLKLPASLTGLMGELRVHDRQHRKQIEQLKMRLEDKGKSQQEVALAVQQRYEQIISGDTSCAGLMQQIERRHQQERESLMSALKIDPNIPMNKALLMEYARIIRQLSIMEEDRAFVSVATAVGLSERAVEQKPDRSDWDRSRTERLAQLRLESRGVRPANHSSRDQPDVEALDKSDLIELHAEVTREVTKKHFYEKEILMELLVSKDTSVGVDRARKLKPEDRKAQLKVLQSQHKQWKANPRADPGVLLQILTQGVSIKFEERRVELETGGVSRLTNEVLREILLADLHQRQGGDFEGTLHDLQNMTKRQVIVSVGHQCEARIGEHFDNVAFVILGTVDITEEDEEYIKALDHKYEILRKRIFLMALRDRMDWNNMSRDEKHAAIKEKVRQEKQFRSDGKFPEMEELLGPKASILPALRSLIGEDKAEYHRRRQAQKTTEIPVDQTEVLNLLADLVPRRDKEEEYLLSWLHAPEARSLGLRIKHMRIVEIKVEECRVEMEEDFEIATLSAGLMERVRDTLNNSRHQSDIERQSELAGRRVRQRRVRLQHYEEYRMEPTITKDKVPPAGDITGLQVVYLREMLKRHTDERETLLGHLQEDSLEDLVEAASAMTEDERQRRLIELQTKRQALNLTVPDDQEEHVSILEECAALRAVSVREQLVAQGNSGTMETVAMAVLAELQEEQDREVALTLVNIENMNEEDIRTSLSRELNNRLHGNAWNVITVLTRYQGEATDELLIKALENKYTVLRQKLLVDCLRIRMGTDQWEALSQNEKHQKLMIIDNQALEQIKIGKIMPSLLGEGFHLQETVTQLIGVCQHVFRNKVKGQQVLGNHSNLSMSEDPGAVSKKSKPDNPLKALITRLEEEKHALLRQLKGHAEDHFSEQERLVQLTRYHRDVALASHGESFVTVATMIGLCERQQEEIKFRLERDVERYCKLADHWIKDIDRGTQRSLEADSPITNSLVEHMDYIVALLENKHIKERELFTRLLANTGKMGSQQEEVAMISSQERHVKMAELREQREKTLKDRGVENMEVLTEGTVYKVEDRRGIVSPGEALEEGLMASLLEAQNSEAERIIRNLAGKLEDDIMSEARKIEQDTRSNISDNIAWVVLNPDPRDSSSHDDIIEALEGKYDALKDKLLAEALIKELGESEWNRMSEKERQRRIFQLKLKERQLRKGEQVDEANALLAELLQDQERLRELMGDTTQDQRRRLEERLRRRKERLAQGMSEDEVMELERQEMALEDQEERYRDSNIMDDLNNRFQQEKDELLRRLGELGDQTDRDRERQALLARLRRDQRLAEREGNFDSAALILGLAEEREKDLQLQLEEERRRQEMLARERLQAARMRRQGKGEEEPIPVDTEDPASLQLAITRTLDQRHELERQKLMKLMQESEVSPVRRAAEKVSEEERADRLFELNERYKNWANSDDHDLAEQLELLRDAIGVMLEILRAESAMQGREVTEDDLQVTLLADLQQQQDRETNKMLADLHDKDLTGLQQLLRAVTSLSDTGSYDNIAALLLGGKSRSQDEGQDQEEAKVVKALEEKYDAIRDKLMIEALMKELGETEWNHLSEKQRQQKLIEMKLKERQLRRAGKFDEIADLIGAHLENEKLLDEMVVETAKQQRERLEARLARRRQVVAEREAEGLETDDATIDGIMEQEEEEERKVRRRVKYLENLQSNFDAEKRQLLQSLSNQTNKVEQERQRQIALARLKRDERRARRGEKLNEVVMIIQQSKEGDKRREQTITAERDRQRNVARERLEARRNRRGRKSGMSQHGKEEMDPALADAIRDMEGLSIQEALLTTLEVKQEEELDTMMGLLDIAKATLRPADKPDEDLKLSLTQLEQDHQKWRRHSTQQVAELNESTMTQEQSENHLANIAANKSDQLKLLSDAVHCRMEVERRYLNNARSDLAGDAVEEEVELTMVTDLQEKQTAEGRGVQKLLENQNEEVLREMRRSLHVGCREGWYDNLTGAIFHLSHPDHGSEDEEMVEEKFEEKLAELDRELEEETEKAIQSARALGDDVDIDAIRRQLLEEHEQAKQKLLSEKDNQKEAMRRKLEARRLNKEQKDWEDYSTRALLRQAAEVKRHIENSVTQEKGRQSNVLQQKLAERRYARREAKSMKESDTRENTLDLQDNKNRAISSRGSNETPLPPFGGMRREKTVVDVEVSDEQKAALLSQMVQHQKNLQSKITEQQRKQEEMLRRRLDVRKGRQTDEAAEVFSIGQRQKTILEKTQQDEKARQLQTIQERVIRQREKRSPSPGLKKIRGKEK
ncbi:trichohyalin-like [Mya arenaria]|uniref:trichohyalin-like n=1 Tax=Mya arenaria TaxID=6604 RepID=UPI0022E41E64|nr:trichohyalin-like [Mya arenaria]